MNTLCIVEILFLEKLDIQVYSCPGDAFVSAPVIPVVSIFHLYLPLPVSWQQPAPHLCQTVGVPSSEKDMADSCSQAQCSHSGARH